MKKTILLSVCLFVASLSTFGASLSSIMLQHNGSVTMYESDKMSSAISAAVKGDTIYLSEGSFVGDFTINKEITIIGAGQLTIVQGNITIAIENTPTLTAHLLDAIKVPGNYKVNVTKAVKNLKIRKCYIYEFGCDAAVTDLNIDRCNMDYFNPSTYVKSGNVLNSYISTIRSVTTTPINTVNYINCNINSIENYYSYGNRLSAGTFISCIVGTTSSSAFTNCLFINTAYPSKYSLDASSSCQNCYEGGYSWTQYTEEKTGVKYFTVDSDWLESNNYKGTDGTIIGMFGGSIPYSLVPNVPTVTESKVSVDTSTKKLNVTLKVTAN